MVVLYRNIPKINQFVDISSINCYNEIVLIYIYMPVEAFHSYEPAQYRLPARGEITRGEEVDNPNDRVDSTLKTEQ